MGMGNPVMTVVTVTSVVSDPLNSAFDPQAPSSRKSSRPTELCAPARTAGATCGCYAMLSIHASP